MYIAHFYVYMYTCTILLISVASNCDMDPPAIEMGNRTTLEPTNKDIVGGQANYSCNENCVLQGSSSLRCIRVVSGITTGSYEWVNGSGVLDFPSCHCAGQLCFSMYVD